MRPPITDIDNVLATLMSARKNTPLARVRTFMEIALTVFPPESLADRNACRRARRRLRYFISSDPELLSRLQKAGYRTSLSYMTDRQIAILSEYV